MLTFRKLVILPTVGASLLVAACGGSSHNRSSTSPAANVSPPASQPSSSSGSGPIIGTASGPIGTYLTGASGRALYLWVADSNGKSSCSGACASVWPPLTAGSMPKVTGGASATELSLISRSDGTKQVAYKGHPLYYYAPDAHPGMLTGQGSNGFGAKWWLVAPSGNAITNAGSSASASTNAASSSASGSPSGGSSGGGWG